VTWEGTILAGVAAVKSTSTAICGKIKQPDEHSVPVGDVRKT
jgi:hypothetical protein